MAATEKEERRNLWLCSKTQGPMWNEEHSYSVWLQRETSMKRWLLALQIWKLAKDSHDSTQRQEALGAMGRVCSDAQKALGPGAPAEQTLCK